MPFPTPQEIEKKKVEKLGPQISALEDKCINIMLEEGLPAKVPLSDFPATAREQVLYSAMASGWKVRLDYDAKLGDVLVVDDMPAVPPMTFKQKITQLFKILGSFFKGV